MIFKRWFRSRYLKQLRHLQVVVKHQERQLRQYKDIDPLQHYYLKQRVNELEVLVDLCREEEFMKKYREQRRYAIELEAQIKWLQDHYEWKMSKDK